jgi:hypothetical protein
MIAWRMLWKDWGFSAALFSQAKHFLALATDSSPGTSQEGLIRASIVFFLMSFEAFFVELIKGYIQQNRATLKTEHPEAVAKVEEALKKKRAITDAVREWPKLLTGNSLDSTTEPYQNFKRLTKYRNFLVHGKITEPIPGWGELLAQDVETVDSAALAQRTVSAMLKVVSSHFGIGPPTWI